MAWYGDAWDATGGRVWDAHQQANEDERIFGLNPDKGLYQFLDSAADMAGGVLGWNPLPDWLPTHPADFPAMLDLGQTVRGQFEPTETFTPTDMVASLIEQGGRDSADWDRGDLDASGSQVFANEMYQNQGAMPVVEAGPSVADLVAQLVAMKERNVKGAAARKREGLASGEVARLERLRSDEADAFARLKELEAARVEQEERVAGKITQRGEDAIADWATRVADAEGRMADLGIAGFGRLEAADLRGAGALGRQSGRQQTLTDRLGQIAADEAVGRSMDLGSTYDQVGLDLADALWAARAKIDEDEMAQLQSIAEAALAAEVQGAQQAAAYAPMEQFFGAMGGAPIPGIVRSFDEAGVLDTILGAMLRENDPETQMDTGGLAAQFPDLAQWGLGPGVVMTLDEIKQIVDLAGSPFIQAGS